MILKTKNDKGGEHYNLKEVRNLNRLLPINLAILIIGNFFFVDRISPVLINNEGFNLVLYPHQSPTSSFIVKHVQKKDNVLVECIVSGVSFRESDSSKQAVGKILISVDGKKWSEADSAAFIIKGLLPGKHHVKLEVVDLQNKPYGLSKDFVVNIPNKK